MMPRRNRPLWLLVALLTVAALLWELPTRGHGQTTPASGVRLQQGGVDLGRATVVNCDTGMSCSLAGSVGTLTSTGGGGGAPTTATYITQTPDATLSAEQALSLLGTGLMLSTTGTGVVSIYGGTSCTNQFPRSLDASGVATCQTVANTDLANSAITINGTSVSLGGTRTLTLASADFVNQGTTTTFLRGNAAGNPSFASINLATDVGTSDLPYANLTAAGSASKLLGRGDSGAGDWQEITLGANLTMTGTTLAASGGAGSGTVTNTGTLTDHALIVGNGGVDVSALAAATNGQIPIGSTGADPVPAAPTGAGNVTVALGAGTIAITGNVDIQTFSANGTWTKPTTWTASSVYVFVCGSGGGGGGGSGAAAGSVRTGGGGGGGAFCTHANFRASELGATESVTAPAGGTGGTGGTSGAGADAGAGAASSLGTRLAAPGGGGGAGNAAGAAGGSGGGCTGVGQSATTTAGQIGGACMAAGPALGSTSVDGRVGAPSPNVAVGGTAGVASSYGGASGAGSTSAGATSVLAGGTSLVSGGGGGMGGGVNLANPGTAQAGTDGGKSGNAVTATTGGGGTGGTVAACGSGGNGGNGTAATAGNGGFGAGGGASVNNATGCTGGVGGIGGGGGGGGGGGTSTGGAGGTGGAGWVVVISW